VQQQLRVPPDVQRQRGQRTRLVARDIEHLEPPAVDHVHRAAIGLEQVRFVDTGLLDVGAREVLTLDRCAGTVRGRATGVVTLRHRAVLLDGHLGPPPVAATEAIRRHELERPLLDVLQEHLAAVEGRQRARQHQVVRQGVGGALPIGRRGGTDPGRGSGVARASWVALLIRVVW
jgi:hypothetical protein